MVSSIIKLNAVGLRSISNPTRQPICNVPWNNIYSKNISRIGYSYFSSHIDRPGVTQTKVNHTFLKKFGFKNVAVHEKPTQLGYIGSSVIIRHYALNAKGKHTTKNAEDTESIQNKNDNLSLYQRFKKMARGYWYVLVPVHLFTSAVWFGGFYYLVKSGVDVVALLETIGVSQMLVDPLKDSSAGYLALSYCLYKIATPLRYTVTLGGTTISIKYLTKYGIIKPIPPKEKLKEIYEEKKELLKEHRDNITEEFKFRRDKFKERRENMMREYRDRTKK